MVPSLHSSFYTPLLDTTSNVVHRLINVAKQHWKISLSVYTITLITSASLTGQWLRKRGNRKKLIADIRQLLPKIELHYHLHGSIRRSTLSELIINKTGGNGGIIGSNREVTLKEAFNLFNLIYEVINDSITLRRIIREALTDCCNDGVIYLELRTTPRPLTDLPTRRDYIDVLVEEIDRWESNNNKQGGSGDSMDIRLILGLDRAGTVDANKDIIQLATVWKAKRPHLFVGIDLAGNPIKGDARDFMPLLERARGHGLKITTHIAELPDKDDETDAILKFKPDRLGHALWVDDRQKDYIINNNIGIEICPTSNKCTLQLNSLSHHPSMLTWLTNAHKVCICTDDTGVFSTSLSNEIINTCQTWNLSHLDAVLLQLRAIDMAFCDENTKTRLRDKIHKSLLGK